MIEYSQSPRTAIPPNLDTSPLTLERKNEMTAFVSILLTVIIIVIGLFIRPKKAVKMETTDSPENGDLKMRDETHDLWYYLGFVDASPNTVRQVVAGSARSGKPKRYFGHIDYGVVDPETGKVYKKGEIPDSYTEFESGEGKFKALLRLILENFGKRWYGIPFISNVKSLHIDRVVSKATSANQDSLSDELESKQVVRYGYYGEILRPTLHRNSDDKDNLRFSFISYAVIRIMDFAPAFNIYNDNLLVMVSKVISGFISKSTFKMTYEQYKETGTKLTPEQTKELETILSAIVPFEIVEFSMGDPELHPEIQKAMEQKVVAKQAAEARRETGSGERDYLISVSEGTKQKTINEGEGEAQKIERIARARAQRFTELYNVFIGKAFSEADAMRMANEQVIAEFSAEAIGKLTTYVAGGSGVQVSIPTTGKVGS